MDGGLDRRAPDLPQPDAQEKLALFDRPPPCGASDGVLCRGAGTSVCPQEKMKLAQGKQAQRLEGVVEYNS